tara:strand:- start:102 stop:215 length:114 start_codon:yes stop_codon:yes gene_type:complete
LELVRGLENAILAEHWALEMQSHWQCVAVDIGEPTWN